MSNSLGQFLNQLTVSQTIAVSALIGGLYYLNIYDDGSKLKNQIAEVQASLQAEEQKKIETDKVKAEEREIKSQVGALSDKFKEVTARFPVNLKSDEIITAINQLAKAANVRVVQVKKENVEIKELYEEVPVSMEFSGTFNNLLLLLYNIGTMERVTNLGNFQFSNSSQDYNGNLKLATRVVGYKYRKPPESPNAKPSGETK
ncbi:MAG: hypothetical protein RJB66_566 [Pseudomonadota bacterium]|jgi:Tfp pilus assembly protein PilO